MYVCTFMHVTLLTLVVPFIELTMGSSSHMNIKDCSFKSHWVQFGDQWIQFIVNALNTLRPRQNGHHFPDDIFKCIFMDKNVWDLLKISPKFVRKMQIDNIPSLVQIMARRRTGDKPLYEPMMVSLLTHVYVTRPQWVNLEGGFTNTVT